MNNQPKLTEIIHTDECKSKIDRCCFRYNKFSPKYSLCYERVTHKHKYTNANSNDTMNNKGRDRINKISMSRKQPLSAEQVMNLSTLIKTKTRKQIAEEYGRHPQTISYWLKKLKSLGYDVPKVRGVRPIITQNNETNITI